ncbi:MAG: Rho termination factor N-terminal domain-containing protein, partial [Cetobacterium sp.]
IVPSEYVAYEDVDTKNQTVDFIAKSAFSPVLADANAIWRIEVDLPTPSPTSFDSTPEVKTFSTPGMPTTQEELDAIVEEAVKNALKNTAQEVNLDAMTTEQLKAHAKELNIEIVAGMKKDEIIAAIKNGN